MHASESLHHSGAMDSNFVLLLQVADITQNRKDTANFSESILHRVPTEWCILMALMGVEICRQSWLSQDQQNPKYQLSAISTRSKLPFFVEVDFAPGNHILFHYKGHDE